MNRNKIFISLLVLTLASCATPLESDKLQIYTSFFVLEDFARKIGGNRVKVTSIVPTGMEIHVYEPTTGDIVKISDADMFIYNGAGLEHFITGIKAAVSNSNVTFVEASQNVEYLMEDAHQDPHTWLSPLNAKIEMANIKKALITIDPSSESYYQSNYQIYADKIDILHEQYQAMLAAGNGKYLVTAHAAFGYLTHEYHLLALPVGGHDSDQEPSQQDIAKVIEIVRANNIRYIYAETLSPNNAIQTVLNETEAQLGILNPLEGLTVEQIATNEDYFSVMKDNLLAIAKGFI